MTTSKPALIEQQEAVLREFHPRDKIGYFGFREQRLADAIVILRASAVKTQEALVAAKGWLDELGCQCEESEGTCAVCLVNAALGLEKQPKETQSCE